MAINKKLNLPADIAGNLQQMGRIYGKMDSTNLAFKSFEASNQYFTEINKPAGRGINFVNMATLLQNEGKFEAAMSMFRQAESILQEVGDKKNLAAARTNMGNCYFGMKNYPAAERSVTAGLQLAGEIGVLLIQADASALLAKIYSAQNNFRQALKYEKMSRSFRDSLLNEENIRKISQLESKFSFEKVLAQKELERIEISGLLKTEKAQHRLYLSTTILMLFILLIALLFYRQNRRKNRVLFRKNLELLNACKTCNSKLNEKPAENQRKYASSNLSPEEYLRLKSGLLDMMNNEKSWKNNKLNINDLAGSLSTNSTYLSQIINSEFGMNFTNFVNDFRIREAQRLIIDGYQSQLTVEALAQDCGFKSRATFYNAFKKSTGLTPTKFNELNNSE